MITKFSARFVWEFIMYIIAGLGNPDKKYLNTMHNLGFKAVDLIAKKLGVSFDKKAFKGDYAVANVDGEKVILLKPQTYMNLSGESVVPMLNFYKIPVENLIVIYDDLDVNIGSIRIRKNGSAGTHNGMRNIVSLLGSQNFPRIRIGTKPENDGRGIIDYVLSDVKKEDQERFDLALEKSANSAIMIVKGQTIDNVMNKYNG